MLEYGKYYLEEIEDKKEGLITIHIGHNKHSHCIEVHGTFNTATNRAIKIIVALNKEERNEK